MPLKILHTSDWHIGKQLLKVDFNEDMELFFNWLIEIISSEKIDVLLMSGDLFDQANPAQSALTQYYKFLKRLIPLECKIIITGGNHDSPYVLNAPKELLQFLDIEVIGGAPENQQELFIPIEKNGEKVVVAAVPFLRDKDIRTAAPGESYDDKMEQIKAGLKAYFENVNNYYSEKYNGFNYVVMAHLFAQGAQTSESEREIQIGNQAGIEAAIFGDAPDYVALGHIHKPQAVGFPHIRYSGSPISLSFSEKLDRKQVVILDIQNGKLNTELLEIPIFRRLVTFEGTLAEVKEQISSYKHQSVLTDLAELIVKEENENVQTIRDLDDLLSRETENGLDIVKGKLEFVNKIAGTSSFMRKGQNISDFKPEELFEKRLALEENIANRSDLVNAFKEIMEQISEVK
ncbi:MAG: exonuclease subunit SbcD [Flavobacteriales bacterium]|nr:exonuclease subunit SbcD [Flavobacteriales bacterium]